jgi:hypothetical protein
MGDDSLAWLRLDDLRARIAQWAERYRGRATIDDPILDPDLYWRPYDGSVLATVDLSTIRWGDGGSGDARATIKDHRLEIGAKGDLSVRWYGREAMRHPPVDLSMFVEGLKREQARNLERGLARIGQPGGIDVLMLIWESPVGEPNVLVLQLTRPEGGEVVATAVRVARTDEDVLILRAGPDAAALRAKSVVIFGQGAIGSNLAVILARSGVGQIKGVDGERLRPGDLVRHAGIRISVGDEKTSAVGLMIRMVAPWATYRPIETSSWDPDAIARACDGADLVIDAVGESSFTDQLSRRFVDVPVPLLSIALFRGGAVARTRVRFPGGMPLHDRTEAEVFPVVPPGPLEPTPAWETGCASPVNNAPPTAVMSAAALAARVAVEVLTGREVGNFDAVEVYQSLEVEHFDRVGYARYDG